MSRTSFVVLLALFACNNKESADPTETGDSFDTGGEITQNDQDGDLILDVHEGEEDADGDGDPNMLDKDSDDDGIKDKVESGDDELETLPVDSDGDGVEDFLDTDSDNNCVSDADEKGGTPAVDTDGDGVRDYADDDNDGDGILDVEEIGDTFECNPTDTDGDGTPDYMDLDSDGDGIGDVYEWGGSEFDPDPVDSDGDGIPDYQDTDSDNDGISDAEESGTGSIDVEPADTDGDGEYDFQDTDSDGDGLSDYDEENVYGTDRLDFDSDGDGFSDGGEVLAGTDPLDSDSVIDGIYIEVGERTETEEDFQFELHIQRGDIAFLLDTTCSMSGTAQAMGTQFSDIVTELEDTFEDAAYGFATYDDYPYGSMGSPGTDKPFELLIGTTTDTAAVQTKLSTVGIHSGADGPESTIEAIYQGATGAGYDMNCNGIYDSTYDVKPFIADSADPFNGGGGEFYDASWTEVGTRGGYGFRDYSLPLIIYATDNQLRDADSSDATLQQTPGGCPIDAGHTDVVTALEDIGGYVIGADVSGYGSTSAWSPYSQMISLAQLTGSYADQDGDGDADEELVFELDQSSIGFDEDFTNFVVSAVDQLVSSITFTSVELVVEGDEYGFVTDISPERYDNIDPDDSDALDFTITFRGVVAGTTEDQLFLLTLNIIGDGTTLLDSQDIVVLVPGTSY